MADNTPPHFLREWREKLDLSLETVAADLAKHGVQTTHATLSRIERGLIPYNQHLLEGLVKVYGVSKADLLERDPATVSAAELLQGLDEAQRSDVINYADFVRSKKPS